MILSFMKNSSSLLLGLVYCILMCCTDEHQTTIVHTGLVKELTDEGVLFTGSIQGSDTDKIHEYGFVWSTTNEPSLLNNRFKVGEGSFKGEFAQQINSNLVSNSEYFVWAYVTTPSSTIFGEATKFKTKNIKGPVITSFSPARGSSNAILTITGNNFSQQSDRNLVRVGALTCTIISSTATEIQARLPSEIIISGKFKISVRISEATTFSMEEFILEGPILTEVNPLAAIQGTTITIDGEGFSTTPTENIVQFGQTISEIITASETRLTVKVPPTDFAGTVPLTVTVNGITGQFPSLFTIEGPEIFSINPTQAYPGEIMTITGKNFSAITNENKVFFSIHDAKILEASTTEIKVEIPFFLSNNPDNAVDVKVVVTQKSAIKPQSFSALSPWSNSVEFAGIARTHAASFVIGNKGYLGTGTFSANCVCPMNDFWAFDPQTNSWDQKTDFPGPKRYHAMGFSIGDKGYIIGGYTTSGVSSDVWEYHPTLDRWTQKNDYFPVTSENSRIVTTNSKVYLLAGNGLSEYNAVLDQWSNKASFPGTVLGLPYRTFSFTIGEKLYACGDTKGFYEYNPQSDIWTRKSDVPLPDGGTGFVTFSLNGEGYVGSGRYYENFMDSYRFYRYDPITDTWEQVPSTHYTVQNASTFVISGAAYYGIGNYSDFVQKHFVKFNPNY